MPFGFGFPADGSNQSQSQALAAEFPVSNGHLHQRINSSFACTPGGSRRSHYSSSSSTRQPQPIKSTKAGGDCDTNRRGPPSNSVANGSRRGSRQSRGQSAGEAEQTGEENGRQKAGGRDGQNSGQSDLTRTVIDEIQQKLDLNAAKPSLNRTKLTAKATLTGPQRAKPDPFASAQPITGGVGLDLIRRMGWREGQGLGRQGEGRTEPVAVTVKTDRAGLASQDERPRTRKSLWPPAQQPNRQQKQQQQKQQQQQQRLLQQESNSLQQLDQLCQWNGCPRPKYRLERLGPPGAHRFLYSVTAMHRTYQAGRFEPNRRRAKAAAADAALYSLVPANRSLPYH